MAQDTFTIRPRVRGWVRPSLRAMAVLHSCRLLPFPRYAIRFVRRYGIVVEVV